MIEATLEGKSWVCCRCGHRLPGCAACYGCHCHHGNVELRAVHALESALHTIGWHLRMAGYRAEGKAWAK